MYTTKIKYFVLLLTIVTITPTFIMTTTSEPPPEPVTEYFYSAISSYVSEEQPNSNFNSGTEKYYLMTGEGAEFLYNYLSFVKFSSIDLPEDAEIQEAEIGLYLPSNPENIPVKMYYVREPWFESTITWNNKPLYKVYSKITGLIDTITISTTGWHYWDATSLVEDWVDGTKSNYGVAFESLEGEDLRFYSDDSSYYKPRLRITYLSSDGESEEPPEEPPEDTVPCAIEYTVSPENPQSGDTVSISVNATDDVAMEYISIQKGGVEVEYCEAISNETTLLCSYSEVFSTPGNFSFSIFADDKGAESAVGVTFYVDVQGTGSNPVVTLEIEFDTDDASPAEHRLLPMDGQRVDITATATDPDGIDMMTINYDGMPYDYMYDPPQTEVEETLTLINGVDILDDCSIPCTFRYSVRAYDTEDRSTRVEGEDIEVAAPWQWYWGLPFANWGCDENHTWRWSMMESIFGDEVWWNKEYGWRKPHADYLYKNKIKEGGRGGQCYGMCALSLELASTSSSIYANMIQPTAVTIDDLERENWNNTWPYYFARQSGQYSFDRLLLKSVQYLLQPERSGSGLHPFISDILDDIIDDLNAGTPGIISIFEGSKGHAVVPWRVVPQGGDRYNIFIYDPNHAYTSTHDSMDYTNFSHYPFIVFGEDGWARDGWWSYEWNSTSTWNENIYYTPYETVIGNPSSINYIGVSPTTVGITDQRLPDPMQTLMYGSGDASFYVEDSSGRKTGYVNETLVTEIPYSTPIFESNENDGTVDMFMLPSNITFTIHMESTVDSEDDEGLYSLMLWHNSSFYAVENMTSSKDSEDEITVTPRSSFDNSIDYSLRFRRGDVTKLRASDPIDYTITLAKEFYNSPFVGREYKFTSDQHEEGAEIELYVSDDHDDLIVETFDTPFSFSVITKSTESLDEDPDIDYIPESTDEFSMEANEKLVVTPQDWATTSASGSFTSDQDQDNTSDQNQEDNSDDVTQTPGFGFVVLLLSLIIGVLYYRGKSNHKK